MKNFSRKLTIVTILILSFQTILFAAEKKSTLDLGKEIAQLKYELYQIENKLGEYKDVSNFKLYFIEAKKEFLLRKRKSELLKKVDNDKEAAKEILDKASKDIASKAKELKDKGADFLDYVKDYFK